MIITSLILLLLSNAITLRHDKSILYARATIIILLTSVLITYDNLYFLFLNNGIGIFGGLFHTTCITNVFNIFILTISSVILLLTSFYPRKVWLKEYSSLNKFLFSKLIYYETVILNKMGEQFKIIEYSLIILFIVTGAIFLISTSDLVSIFLSIELQSYGLYLLSTIYRDSEPATSGGLMYFLLGARGYRTSPLMCLKSSNSGDILKLLIPSNNWKTICGWTNYSGKVTSQKMIEKEMDNRGSKTDKHISVKEQRVDGGLYGIIHYI
jgi:formate hydrogenlyase subunit 3/multisubunit Na+/H+ antiporter MnhD subunit